MLAGTLILDNEPANTAVWLWLFANVGGAVFVEVAPRLFDKERVRLEIVTALPSNVFKEIPRLALYFLVACNITLALLVSSIVSSQGARVHDHD